MDLSLGTETMSNAYAHHHHLQQQQQQQQLLQYQQQQQDQHLQHHLHYHHAQLPQALSLAPPSGKGYFDFESLEHKNAPNSSSILGHLGTSSAYQPEFALSSYTSAGAPDPSFPSAANYPSHNAIPSHNSGQLWSRNSINARSPQVGAPQSFHPSTARASSGTAYDVHSSAHNSLHEWAATEPHRLQFSQQLGENCLPPGVEPSLGTAGTAFSHGHTQSYSQFPSHSSLDLQPYRHLQQHAPVVVPVRTGKPPQKLLPKRKSIKNMGKQNPAGKTTVTEGTGAAPNLAPEKGPGWCSVCQRNCVTAVALRQHLEGKVHKKQVERQKLRAELTDSKGPTEKVDGGVSNMLEQVWMQVSLMSKPSRTGNLRKKQKVEEAGKDVQPLNATSGEEGDFTIRKRKPKAGKDVPTAVNPNSTEEPSIPKKKAVEKVRCELCNVECNSQIVLEIHLGGKKHIARVKQLQESAAASNPEEATLVSQ